MSIWSTVASALSDIGIPCAADAERSLLGDPLPDEFCIYTLVSAAPELSADDLETARSYRVQISLYSRSGSHSMPDTDEAMLESGFRFSRERGLPFNPETGHFGLYREYITLI